MPPRETSRRKKAATPSRSGYRRTPLASLRVFVAVAQHRSFTRGADALGLTTSAASMQVQALEEYLRVHLFRRNGRQVELTPEGERLRPKVEQALADLERAVDEARADRGAGPLRVTTLAFFLAQWLLPRLRNFTAQHPNINVQIHTSVRLVCRPALLALEKVAVFRDWLVTEGARFPAPPVIGEPAGLTAPR